jgi:hypothetical protein
MTAVNVERSPAPWLAIAGLWTVAVVQPLFDLIARNPEFLVAHRAGRADIFALTAGLVLVGPLVLCAGVWLAGVAGRRAREAASMGVIGLLTALLVAQIASRLGASSWPVAALAAAGAAAGAAWAWRRFPPVRLFAAVLAIAVLAAPGVFLTRPTMKKALAWSGGGAQPRRIERVPPPGGSPADTPVVIAVLDELPLVSLLDAERRIDAALYPNIAGVARDGVWYRNATTVSDYTRWALPSIVAGTYPQADRMPTSEDHPGTLFGLLASTHHLESREGVTRLCPADLCGAVREPPLDRAAAMADDLRIMFMHVTATPDLRAGLPDLAAGWAGFGRMETRQERRRRILARRGRADWEVHAAAFIQGISARDRQPALYFIHTLLPHYPHLDLPTGQRNGTRARIPGEVRESMSWTLDEWGVSQFQQRQLMQMGAVDRIVGRLVQRLKEEGLYDRALVILTADHGTAFLPGKPRRNFSEETAAAIMRVPLIVKYPARLGIAPAVSDRNVEVVDIAPTVADVLGLELSWKTDGVSLLETSAPERPGKRIYYSAAHAMRTYDAAGPDVGPLLRRKLDIFDGAGNPYRIPRPPRFGELVGKPIRDLRVEAADVRITVEQASRFARMNVRADPVPFDVAGEIHPAGRAGHPAFVAVAVNGTVRAVTRTWDSEPSRWLATPPLDAWRDGENDLQVFAIDEDAAGIVLKQPRPPA